MFLEQRQAHIVELLEANGSVSLNELAGRFGISGATVRRDLSDLEKKGLLKRTYGGAVRISSILFERDYREEQQSNAREKEAIAQAVAQLIKDGDAIILDSGTTTEKVASALHDRDITIITNSATIPADSQAQSFRPTLYKAGGLYRANTRSIVGSEAERFIRALRPDKAIIGINAIKGDELTTPHVSERDIKRAMIDVSKEKYLVVDHTKFGRESLSVVANIREFDAIITDAGVPADVVAYYHSLGIQVITGASGFQEQ